MVVWQQQSLLPGAATAAAISAASSPYQPGCCFVHTHYCHDTCQLWVGRQLWLHNKLKVVQQLPHYLSLTSNLEWIFFRALKKHSTPVELYSVCIASLYGKSYLVRLSSSLERLGQFGRLQQDMMFL